jgi:protein-tyrosine-phosphatase/DNA-binding HxlR family transcriptional regulator
VPSDAVFERRVAIHAALGDAARLAIVDDLAVSDRSPKELSDRHRLATNLLAHHLHVLEAAGIVQREVSAGDGRRRYVRLVRAQHDQLRSTGDAAVELPDDVLFLCTHNSARSQLAAALWTARTGRNASSAGTQPAPRVHRGAIAAARRAGLDLTNAVPREVGRIPVGVQVVTVCDMAHEDLEPTESWWHWSTPDPVPSGTAEAFDAVLADLGSRISAATHGSRRLV